MRTFEAAEIQSIVSYFKHVIGLKEQDKLKDLTLQEILAMQDNLADVLQFVEQSAVKFPEGQTYLNQLGAVLIRLSFIKHCNRHETPQEFSELIGNYKIKQSTLQLNVSDLV